MSKRFSGNPQLQTLVGNEIIPGTTVNGGLDTDGNAVGSGNDIRMTPAMIKQYMRRDAVNNLSISSGVVTVNLALGDYFVLDMTADVTGWSFTNLPGSGRGISIMILVIQGSPARTLEPPSNSKWTKGSQTALSSTNDKEHTFALTSFTNGSSWKLTLQEDE